MDVVARETRNGLGIVAKRSFEEGEVLYEVTGVFISGNAEDDIDETTRANTFRYSEDLYISPDGTIGDFQNHSCEPNAMVVKKNVGLFVVAMAPIKKNDEVLIDYSTIIAADDIWEMRCNCGSAQCRGTIKSFDTLPIELRTAYVDGGVVPEYIVSISE